MKNIPSNLDMECILIPAKQSLQDAFLSIVKEWNYSLNSKGPEDYLPYSNKRASMGGQNQQPHSAWINVPIL